MKHLKLYFRITLFMLLWFILEATNYSIIRILSHNFNHYRIKRQMVNNYKDNEEVFANLFDSLHGNEESIPKADAIYYGGEVLFPSLSQHDLTLLQDLNCNQISLDSTNTIHIRYDGWSQVYAEYRFNRNSNTIPNEYIKLSTGISCGVFVSGLFCDNYFFKKAIKVHLVIRYLIPFVLLYFFLKKNRNANTLTF